MEKIINFLVKKGMERKQLENASEFQLNEIYNKLMNPYKYEEGETPVTKVYLRNYLERYGMKEVKALMLHFYNVNRMKDWVKTALFIKEYSKKLSA